MFCRWRNSEHILLQNNRIMSSVIIFFTQHLFFETRHFDHVEQMFASTYELLKKYCQITGIH